MKIKQHIKHAMILFMITTMIFSATGCNERDLPKEETVVLNSSNQESSSSNSSNKGTSSNNKSSNSNAITYKFMLEDKLFVDTGEIEHGVTCGVMDRGFEEIIPLDQIPTQNGQVNFEGSNEAQFGRRENRMTAVVDDEWHIFAYNENSYDGIEMAIKEASSTQLVIELTNKLRKEFTYGENYIIEFYDTETDQWLPVDEIVENAAFKSIGIILPAAKTVEVTIDFEWLYGPLKAGEYRIVKDVLDITEPGVYEKYWYMAEFTIE